LLPDGTVLVAGGEQSFNLFFSGTDIYDPASGGWTPTGALNSARGIHTATLLSNGQVLVAGGCQGYYDSLSSAELYDGPVPLPSAMMLANPAKLAGGAFQFSFTNTPGASFCVVTTTNPLLPLSNWTVLCGVPEVSPGQFQFADPQASNTPQCFYRIRSP